MTDRPYVTLSCAVSRDGFLDTATPPRMVLSNAADLDRVDQVRAEHDAILVGARTVRLDDPRLLVRNEDRRRERVASGTGGSPWKVTVTRSGDLDPAAAFFTAGDTTRLVYAPTRIRPQLTARVGHAAVVVGLPEPLDMRGVLADLVARGVGRLLVEGGADVLSQFLGRGLADELHLAVAPVEVGDPRAPRFPRELLATDAELVERRHLGDVVLHRYVLERSLAGARA